MNYKKDVFLSVVCVIGSIVVATIILSIAGCRQAHADNGLSYKDLPIPVKTIIGECANCTDDGMIAVGNVIRNRAEYRHQSFSEVCLAPNQFSFWNDGSKTVQFIMSNREVWGRAYSAWQASGTEDITDGADYYFADYINPPSWSRKMRFTGCKIGHHLFYKDVK